MQIVKRFRDMGRWVVPRKRGEPKILAVLLMVFVVAITNTKDFVEAQSLSQSFGNVVVDRPANEMSQNDRAALIVTVAFLRTTAYAEGVFGIPGVDPYRTQALSYRQIPLDYAYRDHPYWHDKIIPCTPSGLCSACTGAYQFHPDTFDAVRKKHAHRFWHNDGKFSPKNQDLAAIYLMGDVGVWTRLIRKLRVQNGKPIVDRESFAKALSAGAGQWASFPRHEGDEDGQYGQGARSVEKLWRFFQNQVEKLNTDLR